MAVNIVTKILIFHLFLETLHVSFAQSYYGNNQGNEYPRRNIRYRTVGRNIKNGNGFGRVLPAGTFRSRQSQVRNNPIVRRVRRQFLCLNLWQDQIIECILL